MKVLAVIIIAPHMKASGAVNAALGLTYALGKKIAISVALMANEDSEVVENDVKVRKFKCSNFFGFTKSFLPNKFRTLFFKSKIDQYIKEEKFDLVHIHNPIPTLEMKRVAKMCISQGTPYVVSSHGFNEIIVGKEAYKLNKWYETFAWKNLIQKPFSFVVQNASKIFALSKYEIDDILTVGVKRENIEIVTNGVNEYYLEAATEKEIAEVQAKYILSSNKSIPTFVFLGNHTRNKGIDFLLSSFLKVNTPFQLIVCGKKRSEIDYGYFESLSDPNRKFIFTDMVDEWEIRAFFAESHFFVYGTFADTLPLVILEAMSSGLPVIASRIGGIPYQVDELNGFVFEAGNETEFCNIVSSVSSNINLSSDLGAVSKNKVLDKFLWSKCADQAILFYEQLIHE